MENICPKCSFVNNSQNYCGICGSKLENNSTVVIPAKKRKNKWLIGIGLFFIIYIPCGILFQLFVLYIGLNDRYIGGLSFVAGIIAMLYYVFVKSEEDKVE